jgi:hypothetical protein
LLFARVILAPVNYDLLELTGARAIEPVSCDGLHCIYYITPVALLLKLVAIYLSLWPFIHIFNLHGFLPLIIILLL